MTHEFKDPTKVPPHHLSRNQDVLCTACHKKGIFLVVRLSILDLQVRVADYPFLSFGRWDSTGWSFVALLKVSGQIDEVAKIKDSGVLTQVPFSHRPPK